MSIGKRSAREADLLLTLGEVSALVANSHDLGETLSNIVRHIQQRFQTDVCSVYTLEAQNEELILRATVGLRPNAVNNIRMSIHDGLTGLVVERLKPVSVANAPAHSRYRFFPESGEEEYRSFLGVPLIQGGQIQGVLVVQQRDPVEYEASQISLLEGVAAQLAILVTNARLTDALAHVVGQREVANTVQEKISAELHGIAGCPGFAHGRVLRFEEFDFDDPALVARRPKNVQEEKELLARSLDLGREDINRSAKHLADLLGDQFGALMQAQRLMLEDSSVQRSLISRLDAGETVEQAVVHVCKEYLRAFQKLNNPIFYERIYDIKDVFRRVLGHASNQYTTSTDSEGIVVLAHEVSLLELFSCDLSRIRGIAVETGGAFSHVAILARSLGIPILTQVSGLLKSARDGDEVFIHAQAGIISINPDASRRSVLLRYAESSVKDQTIEDLPDPPIGLCTTVNLLPEVIRTVENKGESVGLFRSEFLELASRSIPTEEEQFAVYSKMLVMLEGRPLTLRTLDLRAEKLYGITADKNLEIERWDWRLVDQLPHVQNLLRSQLRAALRAAALGPLRILFPMMTTHRQFDCALRLLAEAKQSLADDGVTFGQNTSIGIMIETPGAVMLARHWIPRIDFVCVGSNDLLHSLLGIERNDDRLLKLKTPLDPIYLQSVRHVIKHAHLLGRKVTVCGEATSNPKAVLGLYAMGADFLSVPPDDLPACRKLFASIQKPDSLMDVRRRLLTARDAGEVEELIDQVFYAPVAFAQTDASIPQSAAASVADSAS